ncbi:DEKNAAC103097 [Brettanomyces naardenensis]|uniref:Protein DOM34 homolog n=1 Tax=Brettanomyces naardenensis TaxID=13370 RepID=A0A448YMC4_BRENA|nr:DEKNAAC103097 [Brettanomyces naardenensis]
MKLLKRDIEKDKSGKITVIAEDKDDLWALYNLIAKGDDVTMKTFRNVKKSNGVDSTGTASNTSESRKLLRLTLHVESVDFTPSDEVMRIKGRTTEQNDNVPQGSYHTAELELGQKITLYKDEWDEISLNTVDKACSIEEKAEVGAVVLEEGVAHICLLTDSMTVLRSKIEKSIPKKRRGDSSQHDKSLDKFLETTAESTVRNLDIDSLKAILLVSPGTTASQLYEKIFQLAVRDNDKKLIKSKDKFVVAHSSTGYLQGLEEALKSPELVKRLSDTKFQRNVALFDEFSKYLNEDTGRAWYGEEEVNKAADIPGSIKVLLITDSLFKNDDINRRKHFIKLVEKVRDGGAEVSVFSSLHDSGEQLNLLTGIAVILNYPIPNLDEE